MKEEKKIYVITERDEYSHCEILAITSTREKAEAYIKGTRNIQYVGDGEIEEWALDLPESDWIIVLVGMAKNGDVDFATQQINDGFGYQGFNAIGELLWAVKTRDKKRAIEVVNEKREMILQKGRWGNEVACKELFNEKNK